jgi:hypothetical protein
MSDYAAGEALFLTRIQALAQFDAGNSARGKWGLLNSGNDDQYAILKPGPRLRAASGLSGQVMDTHQTVIQLYQRYKDDGTSLTDLEAIVDVLINELDTYPYMSDSGGSVVMAKVVEVREYQEILARDGGGPLWLLAEIVGEWDEETNITLAE